MWKVLRALRTRAHTAGGNDSVVLFTADSTRELESEWKLDQVIGGALRAESAIKVNAYRRLRIPLRLCCLGIEQEGIIGCCAWGVEHWLVTLQ